MPPDLVAIAPLALAIATALLAGTVRGLTGFGLSLVCVPIFVVIFGPHVAVPVAVSMEVLSSAVMLRRAWSSVRWRTIGTLQLWSLAGLPLGAWLLLYLSPASLKLIIGLIAISFGVAVLGGLGGGISYRRGATAVAGFLSGLCNGGTSMSGPPIVLLMASQNNHKETFRADLVVYFGILDLATLFIFAWGNLLTAQVGLTVLQVAPALLAGLFVGGRLFPYVDASLFRRVALAIVVTTGLVAVGSVLL